LIDIGAQDDITDYDDYLEDLKKAEVKAAAKAQRLPRALLCGRIDQDGHCFRKVQVKDSFGVREDDDVPYQRSSRRKQPVRSMGSMGGCAVLQNSKTTAPDCLLWLRAMYARWPS
jgi:hypothetical protein